MTTEQKKFCEEIGRCELCGSKRNLQLHHMIPMVCQPDEDDNLLKRKINLDCEDNWICVCSSCHSRLTPKNLLCKYAMNRAVVRNKKIIAEITVGKVWERFCKYVSSFGDMHLDVNDWFDAMLYAIGEKNDTVREGIGVHESQRKHHDI